MPNPFLCVCSWDEWIEFWLSTRVRIASRLPATTTNPRCTSVRAQRLAMLLRHTTRAARHSSSSKRPAVAAAAATAPYQPRRSVAHATGPSSVDLARPALPQQTREQQTKTSQQGRAFFPSRPASPAIMRSVSSASGNTPHTNGLIHATSPYLLQHAHNPVDWVPWSQDALDRAKAEGKMIFLSSGYAACHWCHVMAHESFEDEAIANVMNENFVCIKLDREERPDVDAAFMTFVQATSGRGGWPMSVFLTPEAEPLFGGTYFPPPMFTELIGKLTHLWGSDRERCLSSARDIATQLREVAQQGMSKDGTADLPGLSVISKAARHWLLSHDMRNGGFGDAPKFPSPPNTFHLLHRIVAESALRSGGKNGTGSDAALPGALAEAGVSADMGTHALQASAFTLARIARGGITDHLGGGIARYSVDDEWRVPHFEKMLYDQGQLLTAFAEASQLCRDKADESVEFQSYIPEFEGAIQGIVEYLARDMTSSEGALYAAEDADSLPTAQSEHAKEGAFYIWDDAEVREVLGGGHADTYRLLAAHFGIQPDGNIPPSSDPHGDLTGKNMLHADKPLHETAKGLGFGAEQAATLWAEARTKLLKRRDDRPRPMRDDKVITSWNGLAISGLAKVAQLLGPNNATGQQARKMAERASEFVWNTMWDAGRGQLLRSWRNGTRGPWGFDVDYAFVVQGLLDLYEATWDGTCIDRALTLQAAQDALFWDTDGPGGYLMSPVHSDGNVLGRQRGDQEGAEPTSTSVAAHNLLRLRALVGDLDAELQRATPHSDKGAAGNLSLPSVSERIARCITSGGMVLSRAPHALGTRLTALLDAKLDSGDVEGAGAKQLLIVGPHEAAETQALLDVVHAHLLPRVHAVFIDSALEAEESAKDGGSSGSGSGSESQQGQHLYTPRLGNALRNHNGAVAATLSSNAAGGARGGGTSGSYATVCANFACGLPIREPQALLEALRGA